MLSGFILGVLIYLNKFVLNWNIRNLLVIGHYMKIIILLVLVKIVNTNYEQQFLASFSFPATVNAGLLTGELKHYVTVSTT